VIWVWSANGIERGAERFMLLALLNAILLAYWEGAVSISIVRMTRKQYIFGKD
jgi:hypothetical protein